MLKNSLTLNPHFKNKVVLAPLEKTVFFSFYKKLTCQKSDKKTTFLKFSALTFEGGSLHRSRKLKKNKKKWSTLMLNFDQISEKKRKYCEMRLLHWMNHASFWKVEEKNTYFPNIVQAKIATNFDICHRSYRFSFSTVFQSIKNIIILRFLE